MREYYQLTKPGIIRGNALAAIAGYFLASKGLGYDVPIFIAMLVGLSLVIASGCVFNNHIDRDIDKKMARTKQRALVNGSISPVNALVFASVLGIAGLIILNLFTNILTMTVALIGFVFYVVIYGIGKRATVHGTVIGSISGAIPPVVGYTAVSNTLDTGALLMFLVLTVWQIPHFYAIAMFRLKDYQAAGIPVLPAVRGMRVTKTQILAYIGAFAAASVLPTIFGYTGIAYAIVMGIVSTVWFYRGISGFEAANDSKWARQMFSFSLVVLLVFCGSIVMDSVLA